MKVTKMIRILFVAFAALLTFCCVSCANKQAKLDLPQDFWAYVDGSTATIPISETLYAYFAADGNEVNTAIKHNQTSQAYQNLLEGKAKLILVTEPSPDVLAMFAEAGIEIEIIPIVKEAFVLFVNHRNPVQSLTVVQLRGIYKGEIRNWREVGGDDLSILPYQRNEASGSQTLFISLLMKDEPPAPVPTEYIFTDMSSIIDAISYEDWGLGGLGFSVYFYANAMYEHGGRIRFLQVDEIAPDNLTIARGDYPLTSYYYAIIRKDMPKGDVTRQFIDFMLADEGQMLMQEAGYVPLRVI